PPLDAPRTARVVKNGAQNRAARAASCSIKAPRIRAPSPAAGEGWGGGNYRLRNKSAPPGELCSPTSPQAGEVDGVYGAFVSLTISRAACARIRPWRPSGLRDCPAFRRYGQPCRAVRAGNTAWRDAPCRGERA